MNIVRHLIGLPCDTFGSCCRCCVACSDLVDLVILLLYEITYICLIIIRLYYYYSTITQMSLPPSLSSYNDL